jgi:hypothetical protein
MRTLTLTHYSDAGHGWLCVPRHVLKDVGLNAQEFSRYSYGTPSNAFLEEDCDADKFMRHVQSKGYIVKVKSVDHGRASCIRNYDRLI